MKTATWRGLCLAAAVTAAAASAVSAAELVPQVHADEAVTVRAGLADVASRVVELGDVLELVVTVTYEDEQVSVEDLDAAFFTDAWPPTEGPFLRDWRVVREATADGEAQELEARFRFQLLGCPGGSLTCPGTKRFALPEFVLEYRILTGSEDGAMRTARFRPWPLELMVAGGIPLDEEQRLYPFEEYFPTGAYPEPLEATDSAWVSSGLFVMGFVALLGGLLMWPFGSRKQSAHARTAKRWHEAWQSLENDPESDESRRFDRLRRCIVWYCTDEMGENPYGWVDGSTESSNGTSEHLVELRGLFLDVLQNEQGRSAELQARFARLAGRE